MTSTTEGTTTKREPVLVWMSILAALQIFLGGAVSVSLVGDHELVAQLFGLGILAVGAAQGGIQFYVRGQVTPNAAVAERVVDGRVVAGPANDVIPEGETVRLVGEAPDRPEVAPGAGVALD